MAFGNLAKKFAAVAALGIALTGLPSAPMMAQNNAPAKADTPRTASWERRDSDEGSAFSLAVTVEGCTSDGFTEKMVLELDSSSRLNLDPRSSLPDPAVIQKELNAVWNHITSQTTSAEFASGTMSFRLFYGSINEFAQYTDQLKRNNFNVIDYHVRNISARQFTQPVPGCTLQPQ